MSCKKLLSDESAIGVAVGVTADLRERRGNLVEELMCGARIIEESALVVCR